MNGRNYDHENCFDHMADFAGDYQTRIEVLKARLRPGDTVKIRRNSETEKLTVVQCHSWVVHCVNERGYNVSPKYEDLI